MGLSTDAIHAGQKPEPITGAVMTPVFQTSTYAQDGIGEHRGYEYARTQNPTREALEGCVAALEGASHGVAFGSGTAAIHAILQTLNGGDEIICTSNVYGGTYRLFEMVLRRFGQRFHFVDTSDLAAVERALSEKTKLLFVETPTNPVLTLSDIKACAELAHGKGAKLVVDNTFMSPYFQNPLALGADVCVHSTTKYLNGHSDMVGGIVLTNDDDLFASLKFLQNAAGAVPGPWDCWLALRGVKTLAVRMRQHDANARQIAAWLAERKEVKKIYYPGLASHPGHALAKRQMRGFGGMISFDLGSFAAAQKVVKAVQIFTLAESLGGVESLISHPAMMTHGTVPKEIREELGITDGLVRISVGIEDVEDLQNDLEKALDSI
ncbi:MAG TPA: cystathionine gamma-synthase [Candidatus Krumholzibacteria bacterium]|nr:cystathionine gamma-synthase [Candidatus Krumholzibacteria bacterium]